MSFWQEFKKFALRGNMVDMAIGIIIGGAFNKVVSSLVSDVIMPPLGLFIDGIDCSRLAFHMHIPGTSTEPVALKYGVFINNMIDFLIIAGVIFFMIKGINRLHWTNVGETESLKTRECPECRMAIPVGAKKCGYCCSTL